MDNNEKYVYFEYREGMSPVDKAELNKINQRTAIKERLNYLLNKSALKSRNKLLTELVQNGTFFPFNRNTFLAAFEPSSNSLDIFTVIAVGRYFNVDLDLLLASPALSIEQFGYYITGVDANSVRNLNDYTGDYVLYMPSVNIRHKDELVRCNLRLKQHNGALDAELDYHSTYRNVHRETRNLTVRYRGRPLVVKRSGNIYIPMTSETGQFLFLSFSYMQYTVSELYYRRGIVVGGESNSNDPLMMNFVLFPHEVNKDRFPLVRGLLKIVNESHQPFTLSGRGLEELRKDPEMNAFLERYGTVLPECVQIDEGRALYDSQYFEEAEKMDHFRRLLTLRNFAGFTERMIYPTFTPYSEFAKEYMLFGDDAENADKDY